MPLNSFQRLSKVDINYSTAHLSQDSAHLSQDLAHVSRSFAHLSQASAHVSQTSAYLSQASAHVSHKAGKISGEIFHVKNLSACFCCFLFYIHFARAVDFLLYFLRISFDGNIARTCYGNIHIFGHIGGNIARTTYTDGSFFGG